MKIQGQQPTRTIGEGGRGDKGMGLRYGENMPNMQCVIYKNILMSHNAISEEYTQ